MNNDLAFETQSFHVSFPAICGCSFSIAGGSNSAVVYLASADTQVSRRRPPDAAALDALCSWFFDTAQEFARHAYTVRTTGGATAPESLATEFVSEALGLELSASPLDGHSDCVRLALTLLSDDTGSLDYCHVAVTVELPLSEFVEEVVSAVAPGTGSSAAS